MMLKNLRKQLAKEYPEYVELNNLLTLASVTWPKYGLSAATLIEMDDLQLEMIWLHLQ